VRGRRLLAAGLSAVGLAAIPGYAAVGGSSVDWELVAAGLAGVGCLALFREFESAAMGSKEVALVAMLGATAAMLRVPFAAIPNVQPCTYLVICTGMVFGPVAGFVVGAETALVSNIFLGQGPWTLFQMVGWGLAGLSAGCFRHMLKTRPMMVGFGLLWGYLFGAITNVWYWTAFVYPLTVRSFVATQLMTFWFDTLHAVANVVFLALLGRKTVGILERFRMRFSVYYAEARDGGDFVGPRGGQK
jgi:energy-coupling factor transport system substrate-specific component